jgi:hypothetical protein
MARQRTHLCSHTLSSTREKLDDDSGKTHAWRKRITLLPASFLATIDPKEDWTTLVDLKYNTLFRITRDVPYDPALFAKLRKAICFRSYPSFKSDYEGSALFKTWESEGAGGEVLLLAAWLREQVRGVMQKRANKLKRAEKAKEHE